MSALLKTLKAINDRLERKRNHLVEKLFIDPVVEVHQVRQALIELDMDDEEAPEILARLELERKRIFDLAKWQGENRFKLQEEIRRINFEMGCLDEEIYAVQQRRLSSMPKPEWRSYEAPL